MSEKKFDMQELIEKGKAKGSLSQSEILEALDDDEFDIDQIEKIYETLESHGIVVTGYMDISDIKEIESELEQFDSAEDMEQNLLDVGVAVDDPVRMYLKDILMIILIK